MTFFEKLLGIFNRDIEYVDEYIEDEVDEVITPTASGSFNESDVTEEDKTVIAVTLAALAAGDSKNADYRIKSIKRVK